MLLGDYSLTSALWLKGTVFGPLFCLKQKIEFQPFGFDIGHGFVLSVELCIL